MKQALSIIVVMLGGCDYFAYDVLHERADGVGDGGTVTCPTGFDECDGDTSTVCETDLSLSSEHCGRCGHSCLGAVCLESTCGAGKLLLIPEKSPSGLTLVDKTLYWAADRGATIRKATISSTTATTVATADVPESVTSTSVRVNVDATHAYWLNEGEKVLRRAPLAGGGSAETIATGAVGFGVTGDDVVWVDEAGVLRARVRATGVDRQLRTGLVSPRHMQGVASGGVFWLEGTEIARWTAELGVIRTGLQWEGAASLASPAARLFATPVAGPYGPEIWVATAGGQLMSFTVDDQLVPSDGLPNTGFGRCPVRLTPIGFQFSSDLAWLSASTADAPTADLWKNMRTNDLQHSAAFAVVKVAGAQFSEILTDKTNIYGANVVNGNLYRVVQ